MPKHEIDPNNQGVLFDLTPKTVIATPTFPSDPKEITLNHSSPIVYGEPGTYVDIATGAQHMREALLSIGKKNQRVGFGIASNVRQHNGPIYARYRGGVSKVQEGAEANAAVYLQEAKESFWAATGFTALRATGLYPRKEINARAGQMWREFTGTYDVPGTARKRAVYGRRLNRLVKNSQTIKSKAA